MLTIATGRKGLAPAAPPPTHPLPQITARAVIFVRIALGSQGIRDALRLTLWRATGSTGAWLAPEIVARKRANCGV